MANRMATAIANRMAKLMRFVWQNDAPNPNPNPITQARRISRFVCQVVQLNPISNRQGPNARGARRFDLGGVK